MRGTSGSSMPSGRSLRTLETASRTSVTARSIGVPIWNSTMRYASPSIATDVMRLTLPTLATAPSTFCTICVSISGGAAPGCDTLTRDAREGDVRAQIDGQADEGHHAHEGQHDEQHHGHHRMVDRPGRNVFHALSGATADALAFAQEGASRGDDALIARRGRRQITMPSAVALDTRTVRRSTMFLSVRTNT